MGAIWACFCLYKSPPPFSGTVFAKLLLIYFVWFVHISPSGNILVKIPHNIEVSNWYALKLPMPLSFTMNAPLFCSSCGRQPTSILNREFFLSLFPLRYKLLAGGCLWCCQQQKDRVWYTLSFFRPLIPPNQPPVPKIIAAVPSLSYNGGTRRTCR